MTKSSIKNSTHPTGVSPSDTKYPIHTCKAYFIVKDYNSIYVQSTTPSKSFISKREFLSITPIQSILEFLIPKEIFLSLYLQSK